jgi:hypothetical protein
VQWVLDRAGAKGLELRREQAVFLATACGNELPRLDQRLDEFAHGDGDELLASLAGEAGATPWEVAERLAEGDARRATLGLEKLFQAGFKDKSGRREVKADALLQMLFGSLRGKLRQAVRACGALEAGAGPEGALAAGGVAGAPQARETFLRLVGVRGGDDWRAMSEDLARLERTARGDAPVDVNDLALFALRWRRRKAPQVARTRS